MFCHMCYGNIEFIWLSNIFKHKTFTIWPNREWYSEDMRIEKQKKRKLERHWRRSKLTVGRDIYVDQCRKVDQLIHDAMSEYYRSLIRENASGQTNCSEFVTRIHIKLKLKTWLTELTERFLDYFVTKIVKIQANLIEIWQNMDEH